MKSSYVCTCLKNKEKKKLKYNFTKTNKDGICENCGYYAISIPKNKTIEEINVLLASSVSDYKEEEDVTYSVYTYKYKPLRWTYGY